MQFVFGRGAEYRVFCVVACEEHSVLTERVLGFGRMERVAGKGSAGKYWSGALVMNLGLRMVSDMVCILDCL